ncbi:MAG: hypothetical protein QM619_08740 [Micropruina sp.]
MTFNKATFGSDLVTFKDAIFNSDPVTFNEPIFGRGKVTFIDADYFCQDDPTINEPNFNDGKVTFDGVTFGDRDVSFNKAKFRGDVTRDGHPFRGWPELLGWPKP